MATTEASAESLGKALSYDDQLEKIKKLEALNEEAQQKADALRNELDQVKGQLGDSQEKLDQYNRAKEESRKQLNELNISDARSMDLVFSLRSELSDKKHEISDLKDKVDTIKIENIDLRREKEKMNSTVIVLQTQIQQLDNDIKLVQRKETTLRKSLVDAEGKIYVQQEEKLVTLKKFQDEKETLARERNMLSGEKDILVRKYENCRKELDEASQRAKAYEEKYEKLERNHKRATKDFNEFISTHEQQRKLSEAEADDLRKLLQEEKAASHQKLEEAASELTKYAKRLDIANMQIEKLTGTSRPGAGNTAVHGSFITGNNLLKMIQQYENNGKRWEDIYGDYFDLCEENIKLKAENADIKNRGEKYYRYGTDKQQFYGRMDDELKHFRKKCKDLEQSIRKHELSKEQYTTQIKKLATDSQDLKRENGELTASLHDTSYQLRYLIREAKSNGDPLPPNVQDSEPLLANAHIAPTLEHDKLVFKSVDELQERNIDLLKELRKLKAQVQQQTEENGKLSADNNAALEVRNAIEKLQTENIDLRRRLGRSAEESATYMSLLKVQQMNGGSGVVASEEQRLQDFDSEQYIKDFEATTQQDILKLQEELKEEQASATESRRELLKVTEMKVLLEQRCKNLTLSNESHVSEFNDLRRRNDELNQKVVAREDLLAKANEHQRTLSAKLKELQMENIELSATQKVATESYKELQKEYREATATRENLMKLLQDLTSKWTSASTASEEHQSLLKDQLEHRERELKSAKDKLADVEKEVRVMKATDSSREWQDKYQETKGELQTVRSAVTTLEKKLEAAEEVRVDLLAKLETIKQTTSGADPNMRNAIANEEELDKLRERVKERDLQIEQFSERVKETEEIQSRHDEIVKLMSSSIEKLGSELEHREKTITELESRLAQNLEDTQKESEEKRSLLESKADLERTVNQKTELVTELQNEIEQMKKTEERFRILENERRENAEKIAKLNEEVQRLTDELSSSKADVQDATERLKIAEQSWERQKEDLKKSEDDVRLRLKESKLRCNELMEQIEDLVKSHAAQASQGEEESATATTETFKQLRNIDRDRELWEIRYNEVFQRCQSVEVELEETQQRLAKSQNALEELRNMYSGSSEERDRDLNEARNEAAAYKDSNDKLRRDLAVLKKQRETLEEELRTKNVESEPLALKVKQLELELTESKKEVETLEKRQQEWTARSAQIMSKYNKIDPAEVERLRKESEEMKAQLEPVKAQLESSQKQYMEANEKLAASQNELETMKKELETAKEELTASKNATQAEAEKAKKHMDNAGKLMNRAKMEIKKNREKDALVAEKDLLVTKLQAEIEKHAQQIAEKDLLVKQQQEEFEKKAKAVVPKDPLVVGRLKQEIEKKTKDVAEKEIQINQQKEELEKLSKEIASKEKIITDQLSKIKAQTGQVEKGRSMTMELMKQVKVLKSQVALSAKQPLPASPVNAAPENSAPNTPNAEVKPQSIESPSVGQVVENATQEEPQIGEKRVSDEATDPNSPHKKANM